jgi:hypothetical protein
MNYSPAPSFGSKLILDNACRPASTKSKSHWDATAIYRLAVKQTETIPLPTDPRPWTKICMSYVNSGPAEIAPEPPANMVFPSGGSMYPPSRYSQAIGDESLLKRLDRPLNRDLLTTVDTSCAPDQYFVPLQSDMYDQKPIIPYADYSQTNTYEEDKARRDGMSGRASVLSRSDVYMKPVLNQIMKGTESPAVLTMNGENHCRRDCLKVNFGENNWSWNNPTKLKKFTRKNNEC